MTRRCLPVLVLGLLTIGTLCPAAARFSPGPLKATAHVEQAFNFDLNTLLADRGRGQLTWSISDGPGWLLIDGNTGALTGMPGYEDLGTFTIQVKVKDSEAGAIAPLEITVDY